MLAFVSILCEDAEVILLGAMTVPIISVDEVVEAVAVAVTVAVAVAIASCRGDDTKGAQRLADTGTIYGFMVTFFEADTVTKSEGMVCGPLA